MANFAVNANDFYFFFAGGPLNYKYATRLRYAAITINTTINPSTTSYEVGLVIRDAWEEYISDKVRQAATGQEMFEI